MSHVKLSRNTAITIRQSCNDQSILIYNNPTLDLGSAWPKQLCTKKCRLGGLRGSQSEQYQVITRVLTSLERIGTGHWLAVRVIILLLGRYSVAVCNRFNRNGQPTDDAQRVPTVHLVNNCTIRQLIATTASSYHTRRTEAGTIIFLRKIQEKTSGIMDIM